MQTANRWLDWRPDKSLALPPMAEQAGETSLHLPQEEVLSVLAVCQGRVSSAELQDHTFWEADFSKWVRDCVRFDDGNFGGVKPLHRHFCEWAYAHQLVPCLLVTWEVLLENEGFRMAGGVVYGLALKEDVESIMQQYAHARGKEVSR